MNIGFLGPQGTYTEEAAKTAVPDATYIPFASIDAVLDKMHRQIARYKGKRKDRVHVVTEELAISEAVEETVGEIVRVKRFDVLPMVPEEAVEQMELLGHSFYIFLNADEDAINIVYKRGDGNYGLLQPEFV